jgi:hypothetical protein
MLRKSRVSSGDSRQLKQKGDFMTEDVQKHIERIMQATKQIAPDFAKQFIIETLRKHPPAETCDHLSNSIMYGILKGTQIDGKPLEEVVGQITDNLALAIREAEMERLRLETFLKAALMLLAATKLDLEEAKGEALTTQE